MLEYSQSDWDPNTVTDTEQLESVERWAARFTMNRYTAEPEPVLGPCWQN